MDKSSKRDIDIEEQRRAWNQWNCQIEPGGVRASLEWAYMDQFLGTLHRTDLRILEIGCGSGWLSQQLLKYGSVTATDLSDEVLLKLREKLPLVDFRIGDFFNMEFPTESYDAVVTQNVLAHVSDQSAFVARIASLLVRGGHYLVATQNRPVLERWSAIPGPYPGQLRHWVDSRELRRLLKPHFRRVEMTSLEPAGDQGFLRFVNSFRVNRALQLVLREATIRNFKEKLGLGQTLIAFATK